MTRPRSASASTTHGPTGGHLIRGAVPPGAATLRRRGLTLVECLVALAVAAALAGGAMQGLGSLAAREAVRAAAGEVREGLAAARALAVARGERAAVRLDVAGGRLVVHARGDTVWRAAPGPAHGVHLAATRDSMAYGPSGLGHGAANLRVIVRRGAAAETVVVSRLGRVR